MNIKERFFKVAERVKEEEKKKKIELFKIKFKKIYERLPTDYETTIFHYGWNYSVKFNNSLKKWKKKYFESLNQEEFLDETEKEYDLKQQKVE